MAHVSASREGRLPDFIVIGAMKSGTTTLFELLQRHPRVFMCHPKEPQFFSRDPVYARGESWYRELFSEARDDQICGEASACYSRWPHFGDVPGRMARHVPGVRLLYIMRHPVERAYSHYAHIMQARLMRSEGVISFEQALDEIPEIIDASLYLTQIEQYLAHFPAEHLLLLTLDELSSEPGPTLDRVQSFLGLERADLLANGAVHANVWGDRAARHKLRIALEKLRRTRPFQLARGLTPAPVRRAGRELILGAPRLQSLLKQLLKRRTEEEQQQLSPLLPATRVQLLERLEEPTRDLERFLERPLTPWLT